jgi:uncharacterized protein YegJ (DUF2314 family)
LIIGLSAVGVLVIAALAWWFVRRGASPDQGPLSVVLLRRGPASLSESDVRAAARRVFKSDAEVTRVDLPDGAGVGMVVAGADVPPLMVISATRGYLPEEEVEETARGCEDPRTRDAIRSHRAWVSVDTMGLERLPAAAERGRFLAVLGRVAAEFVDEEVLIAYLPTESRFLPGGEGLADRLRSGDLSTRESDGRLNDPVIPVRSDERRMNEAMRGAARRLPELVMAWEARGEASKALVKGRFIGSNDAVEYMWVQVTEVTGSSIAGTLMNNATNPGLPAEGDTVHIRPEDVVDWAYADERGEPRGMFVERLLRGG